MIKGLLFDMDGVILDTELLGRQIYIEECVNAGYPQMNTRIYEQLLGITVDAGREIMHEELGMDFPYDEMHTRYRKRLIDLVLSSGNSATKPGLGECMQGLKARGIRIALATSTSREVVNEYIAHVPLMQNVLDAMVCGSEAGRSKPAPDIYLEAARRIGLAPEECMGVEDSVAGLKSLTAAGCKRVLIPDLLPNDERFHGLVDYELQSLAQLPKLVDRVNMEKRMNA